LGLAICRKLIGLMGGQIGVESTEGEGSAFWFQVRMQRESGVERVRPAPPMISPTAGSRSQARRVLLVDDDSINRLVVTRQLQRFGCQVDTAQNGKEALASWQREAYDLILMDCQMPEMDGFTAVRQIRRSEQDQSLSPTFIIALTANAMVGDREACVQAGMDDYLSKPLSMEALREALERIPSKAPLHPGADSKPEFAH
jgi:CheY-like chemotaxis protein